MKLGGADITVLKISFQLQMVTDTGIYVLHMFILHSNCKIRFYFYNKIIKRAHEIFNFNISFWVLEVVFIF